MNGLNMPRESFRPELVEGQYGNHPVRHSRVGGNPELHIYGLIKPNLYSYRFQSRYRFPSLTVSMELIFLLADVVFRSASMYV